MTYVIDVYVFGNTNVSMTYVIDVCIFGNINVSITMS